MPSGAEKGLFFTTGYFTDSAKAASRGDASIPVELVDDERLVDLLEQRRFGLLEAKTFEVDYEFLAHYQRQRGDERPNLKRGPKPAFEEKGKSEKTASQKTKGSGRQRKG